MNNLYVGLNQVCQSVFLLFLLFYCHLASSAQSSSDLKLTNLRTEYSDFYEYVDVRGDYWALLFKLAMIDWIKFEQDNGLQFKRVI